MRTFIANLPSLDSSASAAFEVLEDPSSESGQGSQTRASCVVPKLALQELPSGSTSSSSASTYSKDKEEGEDSSTSSSAEEGPAGQANDGYCSCSSEGFGRESPVSTGSPSFAPLQGAAKVPPIKMANVFGQRGITPSFGVKTEVKPGKQSPRRLLSARSGEDTGTARKTLISQRSDERNRPVTDLSQTCEFHQMNDSTDCEYHKLASSDSDSCATQSDEESDLPTSKRHQMKAL